jgi:hypothetical protein
MRQTRRFSLGGFAAALALAAVLAGPAWAQLVVGPFVAPSSFYVIPRNGAIVLSWGAILNPALVGYNVYRRDTGRAADQNVLMNATPLIITSAVDMGADNKGLKNGTSFIYSVKAVYLGSDGKAVEGPATRDVVATAQAPIKGLFTLYDIETLNPGSASVDASNVLTIQGAGADIWNTVDAHSFLAVPVSGDFQVTIKLNERPTKATTGTSNSGKIGLEIKSDIVVGSPYAAFFASVDRSPNEFLFEGRKNQNGVGTNQTFSQGPGIASADAKFPVWLRLVRKGTVIQAFLAVDAAGANFQQVGDDQDFMVLPNIVQVGIVAAALNDGNYVLGKLDYSTLKIENPA